MYAFLANKTAYNLWFGNHAMGRTETPEAESCSHEFKFATATNRDLPWSDLEELGISRDSKLPIHVAVPEAKRLVSSKTVCAHLRGRKFNGGFVHITGRVYAECPIPALLSQIHGEAGNALYDLNRAVARYQIVDGALSKPHRSPTRIHLRSHLTPCFESEALELQKTCCRTLRPTVPPQWNVSSPQCFLLRNDLEERECPSPY